MLPGTGFWIKQYLDQDPLDPKEGFVFHVQDLSINVVAVLGTLMFVCVS